MKILLKTKAKGMQTLVDTAIDPDYPEGYVNLDGSPIMQEVIKDITPPEAKEMVSDLDEWLALKKIGFNKLKSEQRKRYKELKALQG